MNSHFSLFLLLVFAFILTGISSASAQYVKTDQVLTTGVLTTISGNGSRQLTITYRPGSNISRSQTVDLTGPTYDWTPQKAGIFSISAPDGPKQTVSVSFGDFPFLGFIVFIIAGTILFGGAIYAAINLFGDSSAKAI